MNQDHDYTNKEDPELKCLVNGISDTSTSENMNLNCDNDVVMDKLKNRLLEKDAGSISDTLIEMNSEENKSAAMGVKSGDCCEEIEQINGESEQNSDISNKTVNTSELDQYWVSADMNQSTHKIDQSASQDSLDIDQSVSQDCMEINQSDSQSSLYIGQSTSQDSIEIGQSTSQGSIEIDQSDSQSSLLNSCSDFEDSEEIANGDKTESDNVDKHDMANSNHITKKTSKKRSKKKKWTTKTASQRRRSKSEKNQTDKPVTPKPKTKNPSRFVELVDESNFTPKNMFDVKEDVKPKEFFECICGQTDEGSPRRRKKSRHSVQCVKCGLYQHAECVNYDINDPYRGEFKCPHCHISSVSNSMNLFSLKH